jgi:hypothetical protein
MCGLDQGGGIADAQFAHHILAMHAHGLIADIEFARDLLIAEGVGDEPQNFQFPFGEVVPFDEVVGEIGRELADAAVAGRRRGVVEAHPLADESIAGDELADGDMQFIDVPILEDVAVGAGFEGQFYDLGVIVSAEYQYFQRRLARSQHFERFDAVGVRQVQVEDEQIDRLLLQMICIATRTF